MRLLDVRPDLAEAYRGYQGFADPEVSREFVSALLACADHPDEVGCELDLARTADVLAGRDSLEVVWVHAVRDSAEVVDVEATRDRALRSHVGEPMRADPSRGRSRSVVPGQDDVAVRLRLLHSDPARCFEAASLNDVTDLRSLVTPQKAGPLKSATAGAQGLGHHVQTIIREGGKS